MIEDIPSRYSSLLPSGSPRIIREAILTRVFTEAPPIVILQAPAGHGKSTVLQQIRSESAARGVRCGWLNLDESDNDVSRHASHLKRLLEQISQRDDPAIDRSVDSGTAVASHQKPSDWFIEQLESDRSPVALFLDEFEALSDRSVLSFWKDFLSKLPPHVRVHIATRSLPDIGLPRLMVSSKILALQALELCFSLDEVHHLFASAGTSAMDSVDIEAIHRCTEGWPAAIQLFRLGLSRNHSTDAFRRIDQYRPRELADYLTECVLDGLSPETRRFLERTCILNRLGAQVCNALTGRSDSGQQLLRLEKLGIFTSPMDDNHTWFRYHTLLATHLREQLLNLHPVKFHALHRQAADWFHANGMYDDAAHHAIASGDHAMSTEILESWSEQLVTNGEMSIAERWFDCIPTERVAARPLLKRRMVWALIFLRRRAKVLALMGSEDPSDWYPDDASLTQLPAVAVATICYGDMAKAFACVERISGSRATLDRFSAFELAAATNLDAYRLLVIGDIRQAEVQLSAAQTLNAVADALFTVGYTDCVRGAMLLLKGRMRESLEVFRISLGSQRRALDAPFATAPLAACYVWSLYVVDDCETAVRVLSEYREMVLNCAIPDFFAVGVIAAARSYRALGQEAEAHSVLSEAEALCSLSRWARTHWLIRRERLLGARSLGSRQEPQLDPTPACDGSSDRWMPFGELAAESHLIAIRQFVRQKRYEEASAEISRVLEIHSESAFIAAQLGMIKAMLLEARGLSNPAARQFASALKLAHDSGYVRMVIDEGKTIKNLLEGFLSSTRAAGESSLRAFAENILNRIRGGAVLSPATLSQPPNLGHFSKREREIIDCLRLRMSNKEIADTTSISKNTVKFHLKKIFGKLGIQRRSEVFELISHMKHEP